MFLQFKIYIYLVRPIFFTLDKALLDCTSRGQSRGQTRFLRSDGGAEQILSLHHGLNSKSFIKMRKKNQVQVVPSGFPHSNFIRAYIFV